jgi:hypothetical protein
MFRRRSPLGRHQSLQVLVDACETDALKDWLAARQMQYELQRTVAEAARVADAVARLHHVLQHLR